MPDRPDPTAPAHRARGLEEGCHHMKIVQLVVVGCLAALAPLSAGCGGNPCQDVIDSINAASKKPGCTNALMMYTVGVDPNNCNANTSTTKILEADAACFDEVKACDVAGTIALGQCLSKAQQSGG
jgi:hypothetical protein